MQVPLLNLEDIDNYTEFGVAISKTGKVGSIFSINFGGVNPHMGVLVDY